MKRIVTPGERLDRLERAVTAMAWWLVQAQTGFGVRDARAIEDILSGAKPPADALTAEEQKP